MSISYNIPVPLSRGHVKVFRAGPPIKKKVVQQEEHKPVDLGEERHHQLLSAIKGLKVDQNVKQSKVTESLEQFRDWR